jgi:hypothetical protein
MGERQNQIMKKLYAIMLALVAMLAMSAFATSAFAVTLLAEWLLNGAAIVTADLVEIPGELILTNLDAGGVGITSELLCTGILVGTVGPASADLITEVLTLTGVKTVEPLATGEALACTNSKNCESPKAWPEGLPWETEAELLEETAGTFFADYLLNGAYVAECTILGIKAEELCTAPVTAIELTNEAAGTVKSVFSDAFQELAGFKLGSCGEHNEVAEVSGTGQITPVGGGTLAVSSGA